VHTPLRALTALGAVVPMVLLAASPAAAAPRWKNRLMDTAAPSVAIKNPAPGSATGSTVTVSGTASDNKGISLVAVRVDGLSWVTATGTKAWAATLGGLAPGTHVVVARAVDVTGNVSSASTSFSVTSASPSPEPTATSTPSPSPTETASPEPTATASPSPTETATPSPSPTATVTASPSPTATVTADPSPSPTGSTSTSTAPATQGTWTSPEGAVIDVRSTGSWTIASIYKMLRDASAGPGDFGRIAPGLKVFVQDTYGSAATAGATTSSGTTTFHADLYLKGIDSTFALYPESQLTHEYGHVWTLYHFYMGHEKSWSDYLATRWSSADGTLRLGQDSRLESSYTWGTVEIIADDYRLLFGTSAATAQMSHLNRYVVDPRQQPGLRSWFLSTWM
jgi:hypothetical protein